MVRPMRRFALAALCFSGCLDDAGHTPPAFLETCAASPVSLHGITDTVQFLDAHPGADTACLTAALKRPLSVVATASVSSAQPATSAAPRIFLLLDGLVLGVVGDGDGAPLLEFGQWISATRTRKGELELPAKAPLAADAPFTRVRMDEVHTTCGLCHREEREDDKVPGSFTSLAFRPEASQLVPLRTLQAQHNACSHPDAGEACTLLHALFDFGTVTEGAFGDDVATFTGP